VLPDVLNGFSTQDLVELGAQLTGTGFTGVESRALIGMIEQTAKQVTLAMVPPLLDQVRRINEARMMTVFQQLRLLPNQFGFISRERVMQILQTVYSTPPNV
jgi:hypothetical protein